MKKLLLAVLLVFICGLAYAGQKYNAFEDRWETVPETWEPKYNVHTNSWSHQPKKARTEYNVYNNKWEWNSGHNPQKKNRGR